MTEIRFKQRKQLVPVCPRCDNTLLGNNSNWNPYTCVNCDCIWKNSFSDPDNFVMMIRKEEL